MELFYKNNQKAIDYLLQSDSFVQYRTRIDLLDESEDSLKYLKNVILTDTRIKKIINELKKWPGEILYNHKSAAQLYHKLSFLADIGLNNKDKEIQEIVDKILRNKSKEGLFTIKTNIPKHYGGNGEDTWAWALCDAPLIIYSIKKMNFNIDLTDGTDYILNLSRGNGWPCKVSDELGKFRGPGKKDDPCPYATLASLKMFTQFEEYRNSKIVKIGIETLLDLWENSKKVHPYMFYMGNDFRKLKAPLFWYDILNVADVLSKYESVHKDSRFIQMIELIKSKVTKDGKYIPESVYREFKDYDFGQKKEPSAWITFNILRILKRIGYK